MARERRTDYKTPQYIGTYVVRIRTLLHVYTARVSRADVLALRDEEDNEDRQRKNSRRLSMTVRSRDIPRDFTANTILHRIALVAEYKPNNIGCFSNCDFLEILMIELLH